MSSEVRLGNVSSIDYENGLCEVTYPDRDDTVTVSYTHLTLPTTPYV